MRVEDYTKIVDDSLPAEPPTEELREALRDAASTMRYAAPFIRDGSRWDEALLGHAGRIDALLARNGSAS